MESSCQVTLVHSMKGLQNQTLGFFPFPDPHANTSWSSSTSQSSLVALDHVPGEYRRKKLIISMLLGSGNLHFIYPSTLDLLIMGVLDQVMFFGFF